MKAKGLLRTTTSFFEVAEYHFYGALARAASCDWAPADERQQHFEALAAHHAQLALWAENCPENFGDRAALVGAEIARLEGRVLEAESLYEEAIGLAREHGFIQNEGLANDLAARFYAARGFDTIAWAYLRNARYCYERWGANGKLRQLDQTYPHLRGESAPPRRSTTTIGAPVEHLDLAAVVKTSQAVSGEIVLERLIDTLLVMAVEHAGAERGLLILPRGDKQLIEAEASTRRDTLTVRLLATPATPSELPDSVLRYVLRTQVSAGTAASQGVLVAVRDTGIGLAAASLARLFDAFYTTKAEGMGLGLAISRRIIEAHGGQLWATPNAGPGATFQFTLPTGGEQVS